VAQNEPLAGDTTKCTDSVEKFFSEIKVAYPV